MRSPLWARDSWIPLRPSEQMRMPLRTVCPQDRGCWGICPAVPDTIGWRLLPGWVLQASGRPCTPCREEGPSCLPRVLPSRSGDSGNASLSATDPHHSRRKRLPLPFTHKELEAWRNGSALHRPAGKRQSQKRNPGQGCLPFTVDAAGHSARISKRNIS